MKSEKPARDRWNARYRSGDYVDEEPAAILREAIEWLPRGRALDVATGTGRHAIYLAAHGFEVDAIDIAEEGLRIARSRVGDQGVRVNWIQADLDTFIFPVEAYDLIVVIGYYLPDRLDSVKASLAPGGFLVYEHHLQPASRADRGPSTDRYRFGSNELLHACLDLTILDYREHTRPGPDDPDRDALIVSLIARKPNEPSFYPPQPDCS